jgi:hypothetical protein
MARYKHIDMLARHRENDALPVEPGLAEKDVRQIERLEREGGGGRPCPGMKRDA